jgi:hypothetical protein
MNELNTCCNQNRKCLSTRKIDDFTSRKYRCLRCKNIWTTLEIPYESDRGCGIKPIAQAITQLSKLKRDCILALAGLSGINN